MIDFYCAHVCVWEWESRWTLHTPNARCSICLYFQVHLQTQFALVTSFIPPLGNLGDDNQQVRPTLGYEVSRAGRGSLLKVQALQAATHQDLWSKRMRWAGAPMARIFSDQPGGSRRGEHRILSDGDHMNVFEAGGNGNPPGGSDGSQLWSWVRLETRQAANV